MGEGEKKKKNTSPRALLAAVAAPRAPPPHPPRPYCSSALSLSPLSPSRFVLTQFNSHALNAHLTRTYPPALFGGPPGAQGFVDVLACHQTADDASWYAGSADAVRRNLDAILEPVRGGRPPREVVVLPGHALADVDFAGLVRSHRESGAAVTLATQSVTADRASRLGLVRVDPGTGAVTDFAEKPTGAAMTRLAHASSDATPDAPYEASTGVYVFDAGVLARLLAAPAAASSVDGEFAPPHAGFDMHFGADVIPHALVAGLPVAAVHGGGPWRDVSALPDFYEAVLALAHPGAAGADGGAAALAATAAALGGRAGRVLPPCRAIRPSAITASLLSEGCTLDGAALDRSVVGTNVSFGSGARVTASILLGNDLFSPASAPPTIGARAVLDRVIVDRNATVGPDCVLTNAGRVAEADRAADGFVIQDGLIVVLRGAAIPAGTVI